MVSDQVSRRRRRSCRRWTAEIPDIAKLGLIADPTNTGFQTHFLLFEIKCLAQNPRINGAESACDIILISLTIYYDKFAKWMYIIIQTCKPANRVTESDLLI
jgi:hypothetical protein